MLGFKNGKSQKVFLKADFDKKYGMRLNSMRDLVICCMGYEEFETVAGWASEEAIYNTIQDMKDGRVDTFEEFDDLVDYVRRNYI